MVSARLLWQVPLFLAFVLILMSFQDPFRIALAGAMLALMDPTRRLILELDESLKVKLSR